MKVLFSVAMKVMRPRSMRVFDGVDDSMVAEPVFSCIRHSFLPFASTKNKAPRIRNFEPDRRRFLLSVGALLDNGRWTTLAGVMAL